MERIWTAYAVVAVCVGCALALGCGWVARTADDLTDELCEHLVAEEAKKHVGVSPADLAIAMEAARLACRAKVQLIGKQAVAGAMRAEYK